MLDYFGRVIPFSSDAQKESFILYAYAPNPAGSIYRNPGPFHEPGAYAIFLILAIISEIFINKKLITKINIILIIALITTFSTAGFLALFVLVGFYVMTSKRLTRASKVFVSIFSIGIMIFLFNELDFLGEKLTSQYKEQSSENMRTETVGRFFGAKKALIVISRYPLYGRGILMASQADKKTDEGAEYGWITWISQIGVIAGFLYMFFMFKAIKNYTIANLKSKNYAIVAYLAVIIVLAGQAHTNHHIFFMIFLIPLEYPIKKYFQEYKLSPDTLIDERKSRKPKIFSFYDHAKFANRADKEYFIDK